jgi:predicted MPP superfamily phosphohydrolase
MIASAIRAGLALNPDVICVTGDFVTARYAPAWDYLSVLRQLSSAAPTLACLGNHDGGPSSLRHHGGYPTTQETRDLLAKADIRLLMNDVVTLSIRGQPVQFVGVGDFWSGDCNPALAFARLAGEPRYPRVVLNHNPDAKLLFNEHAWDLMLCGHTHGGQISIPFVGTPFAPVVDKRYVEGLRPWNGRLLYVNRGVGSLYGIRLNCRPEVALLTLT